MSSDCQFSVTSAWSGKTKQNLAELQDLELLLLKVLCCVVVVCSE